MKKVIVIAVIVLFIGVGFQPVLSIEIKNNSINSEVDFKQNDYDLIIMFAFIYGEVKNVRFQYHDYNWRLFSAASGVRRSDRRTCSMSHSCAMAE